MLSADFRLDGLNEEETRIAEIVRNVVSAGNPRASGGGCKAFRSVAEHRDVRKEEFGLTSRLILVHDGGDLAPYCNWDRCSYTRLEAMQKALEQAGYYIEQCTTWYSAVYAK